MALTAAKLYPLVMLTTFTASLSAADLCPLKGPNLLLDADFAMEAEDPVSRHWNRARHAGENVYRVDIADGELTITKTGPQEFFYYGQRVPVAGKKSAKMAFTAEIKLNLTPVPGALSSMSSGGLDIAAIAGSGNTIWSSQRNHQPRIGKTDWETVQVVFKIPPRAKALDLRLMHTADGTMQVRNPSLHKVDGRAGHVQ